MDAAGGDCAFASSQSSSVHWAAPGSSPAIDALYCELESQSAREHGETGIVEA